MKKILSLLLVCMMLFGITACGGGSNAPAKDEATTTEPAASDVRTVTGDEGTEVTIPNEVERVAPLIGAFAQMTQMLTPGESKVVAAATKNLSDYFKEVFPAYAENNANNYDSTAVEDIISSKAQVCYGPDSVLSEDQRAQLAEAGIAYVPITKFRTVDELSNAFLIIGDILGDDESKRAQEFVDYYKGNIEDSKERTADVAEAEKVKFLSLTYAADAYSTINGKDIAHEYAESAGAINVAEDYTSTSSGNTLTVDVEQIVAWNPDFIMTSTQEGKEAVLSNPAMATISAVQNNKVEVCPYGVYLWSVRSGEGAMLPYWLGTQMYPERFDDIDMKEVVKDFFATWYDRDIEEDEIDRILAGRTSMN